MPVKSVMIQKNTFSGIFPTPSPAIHQKHFVTAQVLTCISHHPKQSYFYTLKSGKNSLLDVEKINTAALKDARF